MMEPGGMDNTIELLCRLGVFNHQGGVIEKFSWGSITVRNMSKESTPSEEPFIIVRTSSTDTGTKYDIIGNIEGFFTKYLNDGRATVCLKEPRCNIIIAKADPDKLTEFITYMKVLLPKDSPAHVSMAAFDSISSVCSDKLYLCKQGNYKSQMEHLIDMNKNLDQFTYLNIIDCKLELAGDQVPFAGAIRKMTNLTTIHLKRIVLCSSTFLEIESNELKILHLCDCETRLPNASLFKNDLCYRDSLVELNLERNRWTEIPNGIFEFPNLLRLSLMNNFITELPDMLTNLSKLQELELSHNRLTHVSLIIFALQNLLKLSLTNNLITELPDMFTNLPKLNALKLYDNQIEYVPPSIFTLQNLSELDLRKTGIAELPDKFSNLSKLKVLLLSHNQLQYLPHSICSLNLSQLSVEFDEFNYEIPPSVGSKVDFHSLKELSYRAILNHELKVKEGMLPEKFLINLGNYRQCICGCKFVNEGQDLFYYRYVKDIIPFNCFQNDNYFSVPLRGKLCSSIESCYKDFLTYQQDEWCE